MPTPNKAPAPVVVGEDGISVATPTKVRNELHEVKVRINLPLLEEDTLGIEVDQSVVVVINGNAQTTYTIMRGEWVEVPVPVFIQLKNRFPNI